MWKKVITQEELDVILRKHRLWFENEYGGERANLSGCNLSGCNLSEANLSRANLSRTNLSRANLSGTNLSRADLSETDLSEAILLEADLSGADLSGAILLGTTLWGTKLQGAELQRADLSGAHLDNSSLPLCCGSLRANFDDQQLIQIAYHLVKAGLNSKNASAETKAELAKLIDFANQFHRVNSCGKIELTGEFLAKAKEEREQQ